MATTLSTLQTLSNYPLSQATIENIADARGVDLTAEITPEIRKGASYRLACADIYMQLFVAPSISQGGISYSFTAIEKKAFFNRAMAIYRELDEDSADAYGGVKYGYRGSSL